MAGAPDLVRARGAGLLRLELEIAGEKQVSREILRVGKRATDMRPALNVIADFWMDETRQNFDSEGRHASGGWKPLKPATLRRKQQKNLDPRILRATGALFKSLTVRRSRGSLLRVTKSELLYGSRLPYAAVHQRPRATNPLPRRRPVELTEAARRQTLRILQRFIFTGEVA